MSDPREWQIVQDKEGFYLMDEYGEDMSPTYRFQSLATAKRHLDEEVRNWEPPDPPGWEGGFTDNH